MLDTFALISLGIVNLLEPASENFEVIIPSAVEHELREVSEYPDPEGKAAKEALNLISKGKITVVELEAEREVKEILSPHVDEGEASCFICCKETRTRNLVMDDIDAAFELEGKAISEGIRQKISVAAIVGLMRNKIISQEKAKLAINKLIETRDWKGGVLEVLAREYLSEKREA